MIISAPKRFLPAILLFLLTALMAMIGYLILPVPSLVYPALPLFEPIDFGPQSPLVIIFDRPISGEIQATIHPTLEGEWKLHSGRYGPFFFDRVIFTPTSPLQEKEYIVSLNRILPITWISLQQAQQYLFVFSPKSQTIKEKLDTFSVAPSPTPTPFPASFQLNVPLIKQQYTFTCYAAAARMALAYRDIQIENDLAFLDEVGYDTTPRAYVPFNRWGDPQVGVVGSYNGSGSGGYGVHWRPVAKVLQKYRPVAIKENWNIVELLSTVGQGNPVMVWWVNGVWPAKELHWQTSSGLPVRGVNGMHVEVVTGWEGSVDKPTSILTNDPWRGYRHYSPQTFATLWRWFNNTAIVVY